jgi:hypothetical protein
MGEGELEHKHRGIVSSLQNGTCTLKVSFSRGRGKHSYAEPYLEK